MTEKKGSTQQSRSRGRGYYGEVRLAKKVNGVIVGLSKAVVLPNGRTILIDSKHRPDVLSSVFAFESKYLKSVPKCVTKVMAQAVRNAPEGFIPVGVLADREERKTFYVLTEADFLALLVEERK